MKNLNSRFFSYFGVSILIFIFATSLFLIQHYWNLAWDFSAYTLNAKYLFYGGSYFEVYRPPMVSLLMGIFLLFGLKVSAYLYIIFVSSLFFYANFKLSRVLFENYFYKFNFSRQLVQFLFYFFSLSGFVLFFGLKEGSELLSIALFELFLAFYLMNKHSGHFLGLAVLTRYNFLMFAPLLFINRDYKKIIRNFLLFFVPLIPWFIFNRVKWGNFFTSIIDSYYLNVMNRANIAQVLDFRVILLPIGWFLPLFLIGLFSLIVFLFIRQRRKDFKIRYFALFALIFVFILYDFSTTPFKEVRYLFNFSLPIAFFCTAGCLILMKRLFKLRYYIVAVLLIGFVITNSVLFYSYYQHRAEDLRYKHAAEGIRELGLENCMFLSPHWVPVAYYTENVYFLNKKIPQALEENKLVLIFPCCSTFDDNFKQEDFAKYPTISKTEEYIIFGRANLTAATCHKKIRYDSPNAEGHCLILSKKFEGLGLQETVYKMCKMINKD